MTDEQIAELFDILRAFHRILIGNVSLHQRSAMSALGDLIHNTEERWRYADNDQN